MVAEKDHMLAFNLSQCVYLPTDMEHHDHLTELKAIRSVTKSMVLITLQKNHVAHKRVLELHKTARLVVVDANAKATELNEAQLKLTELESENMRLTELVNAIEADKQEALAKKKDRYLRELAKLEKKKNVDVTKLKTKMEDAEDRGFKEGEATYGQDTEIFLNPPPHCIPSYMTDYTNAVQQKFLEEGKEEEKTPEPNNAPPTNTDLGLQPSLLARVDPLNQPVPSTVEGVLVTDLAQEVAVETGLPSGKVQVDLDTNLDDLFA
ncbi:hypothetical protein CsSME_00022301 [Camellia sinensis var. sinensis]